MPEIQKTVVFHVKDNGGVGRIQSRATPSLPRKPTSNRGRKKKKNKGTEREILASLKEKGSGTTEKYWLPYCFARRERIDVPTNG